jgi:hypothetical protein
MPDGRVGVMTVCSPMKGRGSPPADEGNKSYIERKRKTAGAFAPEAAVRTSRILFRR